MDLGESDIWNEDEAVRDAAVRGFLAGELRWSVSRYDGYQHGPGWLSRQYRRDSPSPEAAEKLAASAMKCLEDPSPTVRAACIAFFFSSSGNDQGALLSAMKERREEFKQTPYPFSDYFHDAFAALICHIAGVKSSYLDAETLGILRQEIDLDPKNPSLVSMMADPDRDREWMLSQAPRLVSERPELVNEYLLSSFEETDRLEFLNMIRDALAPDVLRTQLRKAIRNKELASFYLNELGL